MSITDDQFSETVKKLTDKCLTSLNGVFQEINEKDFNVFSGNDQAEIISNTMMGVITSFFLNILISHLKGGFVDIEDVGKFTFSVLTSISDRITKEITEIILRHNSESH